MESVIASYVQAGVALSVGLLQAGLIWFGLRTMNSANAARSKREDQRHKETMKSLEERHEETMIPLQDNSLALQALIKRIA